MYYIPHIWQYVPHVSSMSHLIYGSVHIPHVHVPIISLFRSADAPCTPRGQQCNLRNLLDNVHTTKWYRLGLELIGDDDEAVAQLHEHHSKGP